MFIPHNFVLGRWMQVKRRDCCVTFCGQWQRDTISSEYSFIHVAPMKHNILKTEKLLQLYAMFVIDARGPFVH
jgi:hypothetical protein